MADHISFLVCSGESRRNVSKNPAASIEGSLGLDFLSRLEQLRQRLKELFEFDVLVKLFFHRLRYLVQVEGVG